REMTASLYCRNAREGTSESGPHGGLRVGCVSDTETRTDASVPARNQTARVLTAWAETREPERARTTVGARIRPRGIEVGIFVFRVYGWQREVISNAKVDRQLACDAPIVLSIEAEITVLLGDIANGLGAPQVGFAQK